MKLPFLRKPFDWFIWVLHSSPPAVPCLMHIKHPSDFATVVGFASRKLATKCLRTFQMENFMPVRLGQLGTSEYPNYPSWMPASKQILIIWSEKDLRAYFEDKQAFVARASLTHYRVRYTRKPEHA